MLSDLYLLRYNNYYNRQLKVLNSLDDYKPYSLGSVLNVNFIPNDGIYAKQVINWNKDIPDYLLVTEDGVINSRWFVVESRRNLAGQFELELFRDTLADYYNEIQNAPIFVEKGMLDASNPLIFNQEDMTFNQIRQAPRTLSDITKCPWIIGYIPADSDLTSKTVSATYNTSNNQDIEVENISDWEYASYLENPGYYNMKSYTRIRYINTTQIGYQAPVSKYTLLNMNASAGNKEVYDTNNGKWTGTYEWRGKTTPVIIANNIKSALYDNSTFVSYLNGFRESTYNILNESQYAEIEALQGQTILDTTANILYRIRVELNEFNEDKNLTSADALRSLINTTFLNQVRDSRGAVWAPTSGEIVNSTYSIYTEGYSFRIYLDQVQTSISVPLSNDRYHLEDQPYDMFCIPYGEVIVFELEEGFKTQLIGTSLATNIAKELGSNIIYDIQILPYCPVQYAWNDEYNYIDLTKTKYSLIRDQDNKKVSALIWCRKSDFNFNIELNIPDDNDAINKKIRSQTEVYRLVSPNFNSIFEFNPYKNGGVNYLRVDCSYRPFNPYIRVAPIFKNLYGVGGQYDSRGLILSGDFSVTQLSSAWANYQLQNKNYQAIFDRQIENMEVHNKYQRVNDWVNAIAGTVQGGVTGAMTGGMMGGGHPAGFAIGGAIGTAASAAGGAADIYINEKLRNEAIDYTRDQFGYNLGNIQAIPAAISKSSIFTINNPLLPMLEIYKCTAVETDALRNKIEYNGMTVMVISTMSQFEPGYFKGKLIRLEGISEDSHIVNIIARELNKGVFI